jgi:hypothetical protein
VNTAKAMVPMMKKLDDRNLKNGGALAFPTRVPYTNVYRPSLENITREIPKQIVTMRSSKGKKLVLVSVHHQGWGICDSIGLKLRNQAKADRRKA